MLQIYMVGLDRPEAEVGKEMLETIGNTHILALLSQPHSGSVQDRIPLYLFWTTEGDLRSLVSVTSLASALLAQEKCKLQLPVLGKPSELEGMVVYKHTAISSPDSSLC